MHLLLDLIQGSRGHCADHVARVRELVSVADLDALGSQTESLRRKRAVEGHRENHLLVNRVANVESIKMFVFVHVEFSPNDLSHVTCKIIRLEFWQF